MCDPYPYTLSPIPVEGAGGIIYPAIDWKCFLKHVEPISLDLVSLKVLYGLWRFLCTLWVA